MKKVLLTLGLLIPSIVLAKSVSSHGRSAASGGYLSYCPSPSSASVTERKARRSSAEAVSVQAIGQDGPSVGATDVQNGTYGPGHLSTGPVKMQNGTYGPGHLSTGPVKTRATDVVVNGKPAGSPQSDVIITGKLDSEGKEALMNLSSEFSELSQPLLGAQKGRQLLGADKVDDLAKDGFSKINQGLLNLQKQVQNAQAKQFLLNLTSAVKILSTVRTQPLLAHASLQLNEALENLQDINGLKELHQAIQLLAHARALRFLKENRPVLALLLLEPFQADTKAGALYNEISGKLTAQQKTNFQKVKSAAQSKLLQLKTAQ